MAERNEAALFRDAVESSIAQENVYDVLDVWNEYLELEYGMTHEEARDYIELNIGHIEACANEIAEFIANACERYRTGEGDN